MGSRLDGITDWDNRARQAGYDVAKLAVSVGVSRRRLEQYFRKKRGVCPHCWLTRLRLQDAVRLLMAGYSTKQAALTLGFKDTSYFCELFCARFGCPPQAFVRLALENQVNLPTDPEISRKPYTFRENHILLSSPAAEDALFGKQFEKQTPHETATPTCSCSSGGTILVWCAGSLVHRGRKRPPSPDLG